MAKKVFQYHGKSIEDLKKLSVGEFAKLVPSRQRRSLERGFNDAQKELLSVIKQTNEGKFKKQIKTHCRDMIILPEMVGLTIHIYNGKKFIQLNVTEEMLGHYLGQYSLTRNRVNHSAPGIGATKSSSSASVK